MSKPTSIAFDVAAILRRQAEFYSTPEGQARKAEMEREESEQVERDARAKKEAPFKAANSAGIPSRIIGILRGGALKTQAVARVQEFIATRDWCLVLSAPKGCGKSVAAALWMINRSRWLVVRCSRPNDGQACDELPSWWPVSRFARLGGYDGKFDAVCDHRGPIVIDDLGSEYLDKNGWFLQAFDAFVDTRYGRELPTLITTNLSAEDFKSRYSDRVVDRMREGGSFFEINGKSMRGAHASVSETEKVEISSW